MLGLEQSLTDLGMTFALVLARVGAMIATAPLFSDGGVPMRVRALLAVSLAALVTPLVLGDSNTGVTTAAELGARAAAEGVIGASIGLGVAIVLAGVQLAGETVGQMSGMALAEGADPFTDLNSSVFSQIYQYVTVAVFVALGGHSQLVDGLLTTFEHAPAGAVGSLSGVAEHALGLVAVGFELGIRAAAPLVIALFLATILLGFVSRTLPQINAMGVGFGFNAILTLGILMATLGAVAWGFQGPLNETIAGLVESVNLDPSESRVDPTPLPARE
ncbi:MAG: flagellar biosynthetic protein FliR [Lacipirellulaceae bacterium]